MDGALPYHNKCSIEQVGVDDNQLLATCTALVAVLVILQQQPRLLRTVDLSSGTAVLLLLIKQWHHATVTVTASAQHMRN